MRTILIYLLVIFILIISYGEVIGYWEAVKTVAAAAGFSSVIVLALIWSEQDRDTIDPNL